MTNIKVIAYKSLVCITLFLLFFFFTLEAQVIYALNDVLALTLLRNPDLASFSYEIKANDARILQAGIRPNPVLDVESENINAPPFRQTTFLLSQLIETGGKRKARLQLAQRERDGVALDYEVKKRQLFVDTTLLFIDVLINQEKLGFIEENLKILENFSSVVKKRVEAGKASVIEESNFIVLLETARLDFKNAQNELIKSKNKLSAQWGEAGCEAFVAEGNLNWISDIVPFEEIGCLLYEHPQIVRSYFEDNIRSARIAFEKSKAYPDVSLRAGPRYLEEAGQWVLVFGVTVPIPVSDRNQGRIWESVENLEKVEKEREAIWVKLLTELNNSYSTIQTVFSELNLLRNSILPAAQKAYDSSYKGFELARYNYLELIETERVYRTSKIRYLQTLGEYHKALSILQGLTGSEVVINQPPFGCES
jgi:cobalt-zinc-cadmium efflux system outer membrane protein